MPLPRQRLDSEAEFQSRIGEHIHELVEREPTDFALRHVRDARLTDLWRHPPESALLFNDFLSAVIICGRSRGCSIRGREAMVCKDIATDR